MAAGTLSDRIAKLKAENDIVDVIGKFVTLKKKGSEHVGLCPFHTDKKPSLTVNQQKQVWICPSCGDDTKKGDVLDFLLQYGKTFKEAMNILEGRHELSGSGAPEQKSGRAKREKPIEWHQVPYTSKVPPSPPVHFAHGKPDAIWEYRDADGHLVSMDCRFNLPDGSKEVLPYTYATDGTRKMWRWMAMRKPRQLYGLDQLAQRQDAVVMAVEGAKTAQAGQRLFPDFVVVAWQGGTNAVHMTDWSPLDGRKVALWPDNDTEQRYGDKHPKHGQLKPWYEQPGNLAMLTVAHIIDGRASKVRWVQNSPDFPHKWDIADADWTPEEAREYYRGNLVAVPAVVEEEEEDPPTDEPPPDMPGEAGHDDAEYHEPRWNLNHDLYFIFMGYQKNGEVLEHRIFVRETKTLLSFGTAKMSRLSNLLEIAPLDFWENYFAKKRGGRVDMDMAVNWLCRSSQQVGMFSEKRIRGRGAWIDSGHTVVHCGQHLIVNGHRMALGDLRSSFVYEAGPELGIMSDAPLSTKEANKVMEVMRLLNFEREIDAYLLAGWTVIAPICGAMTWRSHLWVTGGAGTGKSWVMNKVLKRLLAGTSISVQSETTEAGIRQLIGMDALPVIFDEAEGEDKRSHDRMQSILTLMRSSSSEDGGILAKGSTSGRAQRYSIRSMFAFASIGISAIQQSDKSRITVVRLRSGRDVPDREDRWARLQSLERDTFTDGFVQGLIARSISLIPKIRDNARIFSKVIAEEFGEQRMGDQIGTLLAGAYSLSSGNVVTEEFASEWLKKHDFKEERAMLDESRDERRLLVRILSSIVRVDGKGGNERTFSELIEIVCGLRDDASVSIDSARQRLLHYGVGIDARNIYFSVNNHNLSNILRDTPWPSNYHSFLMRISGATVVEGYNFSTGVKQRAVCIPQMALIERNEFAELSPVITIHEEDVKPEDLPF